MAVLEGNGPVPQQEQFRSEQPRLTDVYRLFQESFNIRIKIMKSRFGQQEKKLNKLADEMRAIKQRLVGLEQDARQPRLAVEADVPSDTNTRERTESPVAAV